MYSEKEPDEKRNAAVVHYLPGDLYKIVAINKIPDSVLITHLL